MANNRPPFKPVGQGPVVRKPMPENPLVPDSGAEQLLPGGINPEDFTPEELNTLSEQGIFIGRSDPNAPAQVIGGGGQGSSTGGSYAMAKELYTTNIWDELVESNPDWTREQIEAEAKRLADEKFPLTAAEVDKPGIGGRPPKGYQPRDYSDREGFEQSMYRQIGGNPYKINPYKQANEVYIKHLPELFQRVFEGRISWSDRAKLTSKELAHWIAETKRFKAGLYNQANSNKEQMMEELKHGMGAFDRKSKEFRYAMEKLEGKRRYEEGKAEKAATAKAKAEGKTEKTAISWGKAMDTLKGQYYDAMAKSFKPGDKERHDAAQAVLNRLRKEGKLDPMGAIAAAKSEVDKSEAHYWVTRKAIEDGTAPQVQQFGGAKQALKALDDFYKTRHNYVPKTPRIQ